MSGRSAGGPLPCAVALATAIALSGCATPARVERMAVDPSLAMRTAAATSPLKDQVAIHDVAGGRETNPLWVSQVSSDDFRQSLEASLRNAGLLAPQAAAGRYALTAQLLALEQPFAGFDMTVTARVEYTLVERATGRSVYTRNVATPYTATLGSALLGFERLKLANEGAMRENIARVVDDLIQLKPDGGVAPPK